MVPGWRRHGGRRRRSDLGFIIFWKCEGSYSKGSKTVNAVAVTQTTSGIVRARDAARIVEYGRGGVTGIEGGGWADAFGRW